MRRATVVTLSLLLGAAPARAFDWPAPDAEALPRDPIAALRWDRISAWHSLPLPELHRALARLDRAPPSARAEALRAVVLRLLRREGDARAALRRALARSSETAVLDDPDVALTAAWLAARAGDFDTAARLGAAGFARLPRASTAGPARRELLALEIARWSMARGPVGLDDALALLRAGAAEATASVPLRAALTLALARAGRTDDARALARTAAPSLAPADTAGSPPGATLLAEVAAAAGVTLRLAGRPREAIAPLLAAAADVPAPWRDFQRAQLELARRATP
jgi:hypothetical protein